MTPKQVLPVIEYNKASTIYKKYLYIYIYNTKYPFIYTFIYIQEYTEYIIKIQVTCFYYNESRVRYFHHSEVVQEGLATKKVKKSLAPRNV